MERLIDIFKEKIDEMNSWPKNSVWKYELSWSIYESIKDILVTLGFKEIGNGEMIFEKDGRKIIVYRDNIWNEI